MNTDKESMDLLKAIIKAELTTRQLSIVQTLLKENTKTISLTTEQIANKVKIGMSVDKDGKSTAKKMSQGNASRDLNAMILKNVIGRSDNGFYVRTTKIWGTVNKEELKKVNERKLKKERKK
jgi:hypothetical protein